MLRVKILTVQQWHVERNHHDQLNDAQCCNKACSVMAELAPFSPPAWERAAEHRTARTSGGPYVFATQSWSRVHKVNCD